MATLSGSGASSSTPEIGGSATQGEGVEEFSNDLRAAVRAMELRQSLQVIVSAHDVLVREA